MAGRCTFFKSSGANRKEEPAGFPAALPGHVAKRYDRDSFASNRRALNGKVRRQAEGQKDIDI